MFTPVMAATLDVDVDVEVNSNPSADLKPCRNNNQLFTNY